MSVSELSSSVHLKVNVPWTEQETTLPCFLIESLFFQIELILYSKHILLERFLLKSHIKGELEARCDKTKDMQTKGQLLH